MRKITVSTLWTFTPAEIPTHANLPSSDDSDINFLPTLPAVEKWTLRLPASDGRRGLVSSRSQSDSLGEDSSRLEDGEVRLEDSRDPRHRLRISEHLKNMTDPEMDAPRQSENTHRRLESSGFMHAEVHHQNLIRADTMQSDPI